MGECVLDYKYVSCLLEHMSMRMKTIVQQVQWTQELQEE